MFMDTIHPSQLILSLTSIKRTKDARFLEASPTKSHMYSLSPFATISGISPSDQNSPDKSFPPTKTCYAKTLNKKEIFSLTYLTHDPGHCPDSTRQIIEGNCLSTIALTLSKNPEIKSFVLTCAQTPQAWIYSRWPDGPSFFWKQKSTSLLNLDEFCACHNLRSLALHFKQPITPSFSGMTQMLWYGYPRQETTLASEYSRLPLGEILHVDLKEKTLRSRSVDTQAKLRDYLHHSKEKGAHEKEPLIPTALMQELDQLGMEEFDLKSLMTSSFCQRPDTKSHLLKRISQGELELSPFLSPPSMRLANLMHLPRLIDQTKNLDTIYERLSKQSSLERYLTAFMLFSPQFMRVPLHGLLTSIQARHLSPLVRFKLQASPSLKQLLKRMKKYYTPQWDLMKLLASALPYREHETLPSLHCDFLWNLAPIFCCVLPQQLCSAPCLMPYLADAYLHHLSSPQTQKKKPKQYALFKQKQSLQNEGFLPKTPLHLDPEVLATLTALEGWCQHHIDSTFDELFELLKHE